MMSKGNRVDHSYTMEVDAGAGEIFPLLCPVREADWIDGWESDVIFSRSGVAELGCVFLTNLPGRGMETWMVSRFQPPREIEFCRILGTSRVCHLKVVLEDRGDGGATLYWTYTHTGIDEAGREWVAGYSAERFEREMDHMNGRLDHYLRTGEMLRVPRDKSVT